MMNQINKNKINAVLSLAPALILFLIFTVYPIISSFILSFQTSQGGTYVFTGLDNYIRLIKDTTFHQALFNTFIIFIVQVPIMILLALMLAAFLNSKLLKFKGLFRMGFFFYLRLLH